MDLLYNQALKMVITSLYQLTLLNYLQTQVRTLNIYPILNKISSAEIATRFSLLKRHLYALPFEYVFENIDAGKPMNEILDIPYRGQERTFITSSGKDRCTVVYSINFKDKDDIILGKVFLGVRQFFL